MLPLPTQIEYLTFRQLDTLIQLVRLTPGLFTVSEQDLRLIARAKLRAIYANPVQVREVPDLLPFRRPQQPGSLLSRAVPDPLHQSYPLPPLDFLDYPSRRGRKPKVALDLLPTDLIARFDPMTTMQVLADGYRAIGCDGCCRDFIAPAGFQTPRRCLTHLSKPDQVRRRYELEEALDRHGHPYRSTPASSVRAGSP